MNCFIKLGFFLDTIVIGVWSTLIVKDGLPMLVDTVAQALLALANNKVNPSPLITELTDLLAA